MRIAKLLWQHQHPANPRDVYKRQGLIDGKAGELASAIGQWCKGHAPTATSASFDGEVYVDCLLYTSLLIAGGARVPLKDDFPKGRLYDLFNTKPDEVAAKKRESDFAKRARRRKAPSK